MTIDAQIIVGMETHVQLLTATKLFCGCAVDPDADPNTRVCPVCLGHPGALPVLNETAVEFSIRVGLALDCTIARTTKWDRKSYYYPDLPKNYQISQYDMPIAREGNLEIEVDGEIRRVRIKRAHLEEDAGKNFHDVPGCTAVDLNRTGTPLLEIVTEPDIKSPEEAFAFCTELQRVITHLNVGEASMQKGQMRFEPNVNLSIQAEGREFRTPISEIKNLNSFRSVRNAVEYESRRQLAAWEDDHNYVQGTAPNENRGWNDEAGITEFQRAKESADDYRYFPDPDLVPLLITEEAITGAKAALPEMPVHRRRRMIEQFSLTLKNAETIVDHRPTADLFEAAIEQGGPVDIVSKQFVNVWLRLANDRECKVTDLGVDSRRIAELARIVEDNTVSPSAANKIAAAMVDRPEAPTALAEELGLVQVDDSEMMQSWVDQAFSENEKAVTDALKNPKKTKAAVGFLRGQVMRVSGGRADPKLTGTLVEQKLDALRDA